MKRKQFPPVIISASRATDIPAFRAKWFIDRLKEGYVNRNLNWKQSVYISFENVRVVVFWSKNPKPLFPYLKELDNKGIHYYFQFTLNDYEREGFESNVPSLTERIETFRQLSELIGKEKVIWRFDPIIISSQLMPSDLLERIEHIGDQLKKNTDKLVFSFVDVKDYRKVKSNLTKFNPVFYSKNSVVERAELNEEQQLKIVEGLVKIREKWKSEGWNIVIATCAEKIDLDKYGIKHNRCIDAELMKNIFSDDKKLLSYLEKEKNGELMKNIFSDNDAEYKKDKGQRKNCGCIKSKDIGEYNTCQYECVYCYATYFKNKQ